MKRKKVITAKGTSSTATVTIELQTNGDAYTRDETARVLLDIGDELMGALSKIYRASNIQIK